MNTRRQFVQIVPLSVLALLGARDGFAQAPMVDPKDAQAVALGYVADTAKADAKKYPKHTPQQMCHNCQLYQGQADAASGPCPLFAGKQVARGGWCSAWTQKA